jgi:hypothetical protein
MMTHRHRTQQKITAYLTKTENSAFQLLELQVNGSLANLNCTLGRQDFSSKEYTDGKIDKINNILLD